MEEILKTILVSLVDNKDEVQITRVDDERGVLLRVKVAKDDMGKVIGKQGRVAKAIRTVMKSITSKENKKVGIIFELRSYHAEILRGWSNCKYIWNKRRG